MSAARKLAPLSGIEASIAEIRRLQREGTKGRYRIGVILTEIHETESWHDARSEEGGGFKSFKAFIAGRPDMELPSVGFVYMIMDVVRTFDEATVIDVGITKALHIARAAKREHARLLQNAPRQSVETVMQAVRDSILDKGRRARGASSSHQARGVEGVRSKVRQREHKVATYEDALRDIVKVLEGARTPAAHRATRIALSALGE